jgi:MYXO-CTERM domain-containing protein
VAGPGTPGGLGESCETSSNCVSGRCAEANGEKRCVEKCDPAADGCPDGFTCENTGDGGVCWGDGGGGGCQTGAGGGVGGALAGWLLAAALLLTGRRPRRRRSTHART